MASTIKVDNVQNQPGTNIIDKCGTTITLGQSGDTVSLASGASQTGFGRTGTVDWVTDSIKTATFTAESGKGYFCNTAGGAFEVDLPAGVAGSIISIQDYNNTFDTNYLTVDPNGSEKINGGAGSYELQTEGEGITFVYVDSTVGWRSVHESSFTGVGTDLIRATGGTITTCGNDKIHTFTGPGTFTVASIAQTAPYNEISYLVVAGGGASGSTRGGGGGAGGFREDKSPNNPYTASPLDGAGAITVTATAYPITVGAGGAAVPAPGRTAGSNSIFSSITSAGGAKGGHYSNGFNGGSGSGGSNDCYVGGSGNSPPTSPAQGTDGGDSTTGTGAAGAGGGGGATAAGANGNASASGAGGAGATTGISGSNTAYAGGGGGGVDTPGSAGAGGAGGGGAGNSGPGNGNAGTANTGGGGGGTGYSGSCGGAGGSGIVIIRYKYQ
jgi:hypothetical protein